MPPSGDQLQLQRQALRRGLWRASLASIVVLSVVVALALGVAWKAEQSQTEAERARLATARAASELWNSKLNEARARRMAGGPGARLQSAALVRELVESPDLSDRQILALRQEAIAQLALVDIDATTNSVKENRGRQIFWDATLTRYAHSTSGGCVVVRIYPEEAELTTFQAPATNALLQAAVFSPAGDLLAARFKDGEVRVWRLSDGALVFSVRGTSDVAARYPFFSRDGHLLGIVPPAKIRQQGDGVRLYDIASGEIKQQFRAAPLNALLSPDWKHLAAWGEARLQVLDADTHQVEASLPLDIAAFRQLAWDPDSRRLAVSGDAGQLLVWDIWSGSKPRALNGHVNQITTLAFTPDGSMLLSYGWDGMANFWEPKSGRRLLTEHRAAIQGFSAAGDKLLARERGERDGVQTLLSRTGFRTVASTGNSAQSTHGVWVHPGGRLICSAYPENVERNGVRLWSFPDGEPIGRVPGEWAQFSADGTALFTFARDAVRRFEVPAHLPDRAAPTNWIEQVIFPAPKGGVIIRGSLAADDRTLVIGEDRWVRLLDLAGERQPVRFEAPAQDCSLSPDGQWLVAQKHQDYGQILNARTGEVLRRLPPRVSAKFSPDGRYLVVLDDNLLTLLHTNTWRLSCKIPLEVGAAGTAPAFSFSRDGQTFALAYNRRDVRLYQTDSCHELATLSAPNPVTLGAPAGLAFSSDGRWLLAARHDGDIVAWELPVIRAELSKLGLDWSSQPVKIGDLATAPISTSRFPSAPMAAFLAALLAIGAGTFIFIMQRRMISGYERVEALAVEQKGKLNAAQDELVHSQKMRALGTLAAGIAHDFNNLLSVIRLSNQLAAEETKAAGAAKENMEAVESAVAQGETIVQSMLGYSRATAETNNEYSVAAALSETVAMLGKKFLSGIVLKLEVAPDLPMVQGARGRLEQMLLNLVVNAAEAMKGQGTLRLAAHLVSSGTNCVLKPRAALNYIEVLVSDSGPGVPTDILPRIFEPFFTTKSTGATPGTGLGLSTVYTMAEQDGLGLGVETSERKGTTFRIVIPVGATSPVLDDNIQHNIGTDV